MHFSVHDSHHSPQQSLLEVADRWKHAHTSRHVCRPTLAAVRGSSLRLHERPPRLTLLQPQDAIAAHTLLDLHASLISSLPRLFYHPWSRALLLHLVSILLNDILLYQVDSPYSIHRHMCP